MKSRQNQTLYEFQSNYQQIAANGLRIRLTVQTQKLTVETKTYGRDANLTKQLRDQLLKLNASQIYN